MVSRGWAEPRTLPGETIPDELHHIRRIPFGGTDQPADLGAVAVDQEAGWKTNRTQRRGSRGRAIQIHRKVLDTDFGVELGD